MVAKFGEYLMVSFEYINKAGESIPNVFFIPIDPEQFKKQTFTSCGGINLSAIIKDLGEKNE